MCPLRSRDTNVGSIDAAFLSALLEPSCDKSITGDIDPPTRYCSRESGAEAVAASLAAPSHQLLSLRELMNETASALGQPASRANYRPTALPSDSGLNPRSLLLLSTSRVSVLDSGPD